ncbi:MAG: hypothetical protein AAGC64_01740 [Bacteroidota bacterium]
MRAIFNILLFVVAVQSLFGQFRQERDLNRSFLTSENGKVEIINKYGEVIVQTWDSDSVRFDVLIRAEGKNSDVVNKSMDRVDVRFRKVGSVISAVTEVSKGRGIFGSVLSEMEGVIGNNKLKIDYEIWMPKGILLSVENKFGDVYLSDLKSKVDLDISHGDIKAGNFDDFLNIKHSFGNASFGKVNQAIVTLRGSEIDFEEAKSLSFESGSSEILVNKVSKIQFNSRNDKIRLLDANEIRCKGSFTNITIDRIRGSSRLDFSYGDIYLNRIDKHFDSIDITGKSTDINLVLDQASFIKAFIKGPKDRMILPNSMLLMQKQEFEDGRISLSGEVGNTNVDHSQLLIDADGGELIVSIQETSLFTEKD